MTIDLIIYMGIGLLFAGLIGLAVMPFVHGRAVRLTTRRLEAALPQSMAEIQADKDLLRAEFAMSTRRLEKLVERLTNETTSQRVELGKKEDAVNRLKIEREAMKVEIIALKTQVEAVAYSTKMAERTSLVPVVSTIRQSMQEHTWRREEGIDGNSVVPAISPSTQEDTWTRDESAPDLVDQLDPADTWTRDQSARDPADQLDPACDRLAAVFQGKKSSKIRKAAMSAHSPQLARH